MSGKGAWVLPDDVRCPACRSRSSRRLPFYYRWRDRKWSLLCCVACSHKFVYPFVTEVEQAAIYGDDYFTAKGDWVEGLWPLGYVEAEERLRGEATEVLDMLPRRNGRLLEIGCAGGFFLDEARKRGFDVIGIELNPTMVSHARDVLGLHVVRERIEDTEPARFAQEVDIIVLMDVLEHVPDPYAFFQKASHWLTAEGCVLIRGPLHNDVIQMAKEWMRSVLWMEKQLPGYPLDANLFTKASLTRLLQQFGFGEFVWINVTRNFANLVAKRATNVVGN